MERDLTVMKSDIKTLTGKPARRWEELVDKVIWLLVIIIQAAPARCSHTRWGSLDYDEGR